MAFPGDRLGHEANGEIGKNPLLAISNAKVYN
ncbi:hypothetical protein MiSe_55060 [Microseira wollei NIES-4236]|uniref:Uncharacterized protein n=1 Tax=Microseira wollei NIES-4236 TaxID=2530354 RepID=A0AAV3XIA6_9CYAN|nr:hypothetical protein MiSe_55060 [Microseira wollei NIES-4236]